MNKLVYIRAYSKKVYHCDPYPVNTISTIPLSGLKVESNILSESATNVLLLQFTFPCIFLIFFVAIVDLTSINSSNVIFFVYKLSTSYTQVL